MSGGGYGRRLAKRRRYGRRPDVPGPGKSTIQRIWEWLQALRLMGSWLRRGALLVFPVDALHVIQRLAVGRHAIVLLDGAFARIVRCQRVPQAEVVLDEQVAQIA